MIYRNIKEGGFTTAWMISKELDFSNVPLDHNDPVESETWIPNFLPSLFFPCQLLFVYFTFFDNSFYYEYTFIIVSPPPIHPNPVFYPHTFYISLKTNNCLKNNNIKQDITKTKNW